MPSTDGTVEWFEIRTPDLDAAIEFYAALFGWTCKPFEPFGVTIWNDGAEIGMITATDIRPGDPPGTVVYVYVDDLRQTVDHALRLGATERVTPTFVDEESGAFACLLDPTGVEIGVWSTAL